MLAGMEGVLMAEEPLAASGDALDDAIRRARRGDLEAFGELMALTEQRVLGVAWRLLRDREMARDAAQEAYLRMFGALDRFRLGEPFHPWMYRITANVCMDLLRKRGPRPEAGIDLEAIAGDDPHGPDAAVLLAQRQALVRRGLERLTPAERTALVLRDLEGLPTEEVARSLGVRPVTVRSQISSARAKLRAFCAPWAGPAKGGTS